MHNSSFYVFIFNVCLVKTFHIEALDGREINDLTREFLINWKASREAKKKKIKISMMSGALIPYSLTSKSLYLYFFFKKSTNLVYSHFSLLFLLFNSPFRLCMVH